MSLNNRISFRDTNCADGGAIVSDLRAVPPQCDSPKATIETFVMQPKVSQNNLIGQLAEVDGGESRDPSCYGIYFLMTGQSVPAAADIA